MTTVTLPTAPSLDLGRLTRSDRVLWIAAAAAAISFHVAMAYAVQSLRPAARDGGAPPALAIELAPVAMASPRAVDGDIVEAVPSEPASAAEAVETLSEAEPDEVAEATEPAPETVQPAVEAIDAVAAGTLSAEDTPAASPLAPPEKVQRVAIAPIDENIPDPPEREMATETEEVVPDVLEAVTPEVDVPLPQPRPTVAEFAEADRKSEAKARKPATQTRAAPKRKAAATATAVAAAKADAPSPKAAAPERFATVAQPTVSPAKWQSRVLSWLNRHKRYPSSARSLRQEGLVHVAFTIDRGGRVTSSHVARSSGIPALDQAALDMVRRASPVPAPPPEIASSALRIAVPVEFSLR
ncbi:MAG TPA: TonB family protein [Rhizobiales bacterium]|nr:TonB family protein [Hyphomicrobiales bacterium]